MTNSIAAVVVCPHPPLLLPGLSAGANGALDALDAACDEALGIGLAAPIERVIVVGAGGRTRRFDVAGGGAAAAFGAPGEPGSLPLSLSVGIHLLDRNGWAGERVLWSISADASVEECLALGRRLCDGPPALLLILGDGSGVRRKAPPGAARPGAEPFDAAVAAALAAADVSALVGIDPAEADDLLAQGRAAWQVLAGAAGAAGGRWSSRLHHDDAPYGVGYFVASWLRAP